MFNSLVNFQGPLKARFFFLVFFFFFFVPQKFFADEACLWGEKIHCHAQRLLSSGFFRCFQNTYTEHLYPSVYLNFPPNTQDDVVNLTGWSRRPNCRLKHVDARRLPRRQGERDSRGLLQIPILRDRFHVERFSRPHPPSTKTSPYPTYWHRWLD